jgi:hypothetical protein
MTPEERFERIEKTLDQFVVSHALLARTNAEHQALLDRIIGSHAEHAERLDRIERACEFIASSQASINEALGNLIRIVERHTRDGHGGDGERK